MHPLAKLLLGGAAVGGVAYGISRVLDGESAPATVYVGADVPPPAAAPAEPPPVDHGRTAHMAEEKNWLAKAYAKLWAEGAKFFINYFTGGAGGKLAGPYIDQFAAGVLKMAGGDIRHFFNTRSNEEVAALAIALARDRIPKVTTRASGSEGDKKAEKAQRAAAILTALKLSAASFADDVPLVDMYRNALNYLLSPVGSTAVTVVYGIEHGGMGNTVFGTGRGHREAMLQALVILLYGRGALKSLETALKKDRGRKIHIRDDPKVAIPFVNSTMATLDQLKPMVVATDLPPVTP